MAFKDVVTGGIEVWQGIPPPNAAALIFAADLTASIKALEAVRAGMRFEDEPAGFELALQACKE
jgi:hypothetical protein